MSELELKYIRPTKKTYGCTEVYSNRQYLGYFIKCRSTREWCFETKSRIPYLKTTTRKALLTAITKALEEV